MQPRCISENLALADVAVHDMGVDAGMDALKMPSNEFSNERRVSAALHSVPQVPTYHPQGPQNQLGMNRIRQETDLPAQDSRLWARAE